MVINSAINDNNSQTEAANLKQEHDELHSRDKIKMEK